MLLSISRSMLAPSVMICEVDTMLWMCAAGVSSMPAVSSSASSALYNRFFMVCHTEGPTAQRRVV
eukprot:1931851-Rhodomonas_salina.3